MTPGLDRSGSGPRAGADSHGRVGAYLARQRRLRGISLEELARATRIPRRSLERLEAGAFDTVSDGFVRGFVRTVALALGLDDDEAVARLLIEPSKDPQRATRRGPAPKRLALLLGLLASLGVAVFAFLALVEVLAPESSRPRVRRDPVRALHEARLSPSPAEAPAPAVSETREPVRP